MNIDFLLSALQGIENEKTWTKAKKAHHNLLVEQTAGEEFFRFVGRAECFNIQRLPHTGETVLFSVPDAKRGKFQKFKGQEVIVICTGNADQYNRNMALIPSNNAPKLREYVKSKKRD